MASASSSTPSPVSKSRLLDGLATIWKALTTNRKVAIGSGIVAFFILVAIFAPIFITQDPNLLSANANQAPSAAHWLGTTSTGQDVFTQVTVGTRTSIFWGFITGIAVTLLSIIVGLIVYMCIPKSRRARTAALTAEHAAQQARTGS